MTWRNTLYVIYQNGRRASTGYSDVRSFRAAGHGTGSGMMDGETIMTAMDWPEKELAELTEKTSEQKRMNDERAGEWREMSLTSSL